MLVVAALIAAALAEGRPVPGAPSCPMTPADSFWHADVSALPVHAQSATWISSIGATAGLKADFGSGTWNGGPIGIPYTTVPGTQPRVPGVVHVRGRERSPARTRSRRTRRSREARARRATATSSLVDRDACRLWELYSAYPQNGGASWTAGSGATWDLNSNAMRPLGWTSGDAAGLPILPGLVRYDEVAAGEIDHVIRFTAPRTANAYVWPASHKAGTGGASDPPMGAWFRLKASYDISGFSAQNQVILRALKKHGMVLADNGSSLFMSGVPDPGWNNTDLNALRAVPGSAFEAVDVSALEGVEHVVRRDRRRRHLRLRLRLRLRHLRRPGGTRREHGLRGGPQRLDAGQQPDDARAHVLRRARRHRARAARSHENSGDAILDDSPNTVASTSAGATYAAAAWVRAPAGRTVTLRLTRAQWRTVVRTIRHDDDRHRRLASTRPDERRSIRRDVTVARGRRLADAEARQHRSTTCR